MIYRYHLRGGLPPENESWIFVFGSNLSGVHGAGAALVAKNKYGAIQFIWEGIAGASYAIPTKDKRIKTMPLSIVHGYVQTFKEFTLKNKNLKFWITSVGCGLAGYSVSDIAPMFKGCGSNCSFQEDWKPYLEEVLEKTKNKKIYAGIGSRRTPQSYLNEFRELGRRFGTEGYTLRSGGADGADIAFEEGCDDVNGKKEIWMPWPFFNRNNSRVFPDTRHFRIASEINAHWPYLSEAVRSLYARNIGQILGPDTKTPVDFVVCYTPDCAQTHDEVNKLTGGTGVAIKLASLKNIPVFNFARKDAREKLEEFLKA